MRNSCSGFGVVRRSCSGILVRRYERELYGYLCRYLGDSTLAEDVFQNTFLQLYLKSGQYEEGRPLRSWLYTIATNQGIDALRRQKRHQAVSLEQAQEMTVGDSQNLLEMLESRDPNPLELAVGEERRDGSRPASSICRVSQTGVDPCLLPGIEVSRDRGDSGHSGGDR